MPDEAVVTRDPIIDEDVEVIDSVLAILASMGIVEVEFCLSGSGDSGDCYVERIVHQDGSEIDKLPDLPITFGPSGNATMLDDFLNQHASEYPDGNWCDGEGGQGTVTYKPMESDPEERIQCEMSYGDEDDYDGDDDDDDEDLTDIDLIADDDDDDDEDAIAIDPIEPANAEDTVVGTGKTDAEDAR